MGAVMSKRADRLRELLQGGDDEPVAAATPARDRSMTAGSIKTLGMTMSRAEEEAARLRGLMEAGASVIDLDPVDVVAAPVADRMEDDDPSAYEALKASIAEAGQEVPILVRPLPSEPGRYQVAYGHRRLRVARDLGRPVRAVVRSMTDEQLVLAQGVENSAREDLTFVEQAIFALGLAEKGHRQDLIARALNTHRTSASQMIGVARALPYDLVRAIGRAPKAGRPRWVALADRAADPRVLAAMRQAAAVDGFRNLSSDERFARVFAAAADRSARRAETSIVDRQGRPVGSLATSGRAATIKITLPGFADWLADQMADLVDAFEQEAGGTASDHGPAVSRKRKE